MAQSRRVPLSRDAALVLGLAGTAVPFSHSAAEEAERWLRTLRLHGKVGKCLQALGVGEAPLTTAPEAADGGPGGGSPMGPAAVDEVTRRACELAGTAGTEAVGTLEILLAVLGVYDGLFDRALYLRGTSREELLERLHSAPSAETAADGCAQ